LKLQLDADHSGTEVVTRTAKKRENGGLPRKAAATKTRQEAASEWRALVLRLDLGKKEGLQTKAPACASLRSREEGRRYDKVA
jgi:hypothetical protein